MIPWMIPWMVLRMGRKAVGPVCCVMHVKEPRTLIVKEKGLAPVFLDSRLEHPAGWICARYKSSVLHILLLLPHAATGVHVHVYCTVYKYIACVVLYTVVIVQCVDKMCGCVTTPACRLTTYMH